MTTTTQLTHITFPAPGYAPFFQGAARVHQHGHIWLKPEAANTSLPILFPFQIDDPNYSFAANPMFTSIDPHTLVAFDAFGGLFTMPVLANNNMKLTFGLTAFNSKKYFYIFNIIGPNGPVAMDDPIIVNR
jgi:hypothetical protein